jgi:hypothetical protein
MGGHRFPARVPRGARVVRPMLAVLPFSVDVDAPSSGTQVTSPRCGTEGRRVRSRAPTRCPHVLDAVQRWPMSFPLTARKLRNAPISRDFSSVHGRCEGARRAGHLVRAIPAKALGGNSLVPGRNRAAARTSLLRPKIGPSHREGPTESPVPAGLARRKTSTGRRLRPSSAGVRRRPSGCTSALCGSPCGEPNT